MRFFLLLVGLTAYLTGAAADEGLFDLTWREVAKGVFVGGRKDALRYPVVANTTIVVGRRGVLVFDGGGYAVQGEQVLEKIRAETKKPVTHLVISHWHGDHHRGAFPIIEAFPDAEIITHRFTCAAMADGPERRVEESEAQLDTTYAAVRDAVDKGIWFDGSSLSDDEKAYFARMIGDYPEYRMQLARMKVMTPTRVIDETAIIDLGGKKATLIYMGPANTAGDIALYLPKQKFLATGDIAVAPTPYGFGSYPREWARVIRQLAGLRAAIIVPGHGAVMSDDAYLQKLAALFESAADQASEQKDEEKPAFDFDAEKAAFAAGDPVKARLFDMFFVQPIASGAINEARGETDKNEPLDGAIADLCVPAISAGE
ncbi:MAG: MBL fold metallo-hydrolase [Parvularculaceae bacterium]|nr:MBL fold metallo-hydrolase [Parvularculaceae bacterium]